MIYKVETIKDGTEKYFFIRNLETMSIEELPSKYLMHKIKCKRSPNTVKRTAFSICYYMKYMAEKEMELTEVYQLDYEKQTEHFVEFLYWLKAGNHTEQTAGEKKCPNEGTCNAYLKDVFRFYLFIEAEYEQYGSLKTLSYNQIIAVNQVGVKKVLRNHSFKAYLKEEEHRGRTAKENQIITILQACTNRRDQLLLLMLAETGYRIGELLGVKYVKDIDYRNHMIRVCFREDNENEARAKNAEYRSAKISNDTFEFLMDYLAKYRKILQHQDYLFVNIMGENIGKPLRVDSVYDMLDRMEKKTGVTDIGLLEMEQVETILKNFPETSQRSILGECRRDAFMQQEQIQWEANVWYLERLHLGKHRIDESKSLISISFMEVKEIQNREILQAYMKYELGITGQAVSTIVRRFVCIRNFIELLEQEKILAIHATVAEVKKYADGLRERGIQAKGFNERIFGIGHFYKFMEVKQYITRMPFRIEYFQQKEVIVHHDRSVEETVYMEILKKLYLFPERLRCMFLHLWCLGLRASEVCTLKGNAYYQQGEDYWIQVYQVKMKNYKRIPIPQALYQIMKVYLKKHEIQPEEFIFKNSRGGACLYGTFRTQMIEACRENKIANGEYLFQSHDYRHTVATMFYDSHVSLQSIRDYLGHTYEEMTRQYIDYMPQRIAKANDEFFEMQGSSLASWLKKEEKDGK